MVSVSRSKVSIAIIKGNRVPVVRATPVVVNTSVTTYTHTQSSPASTWTVNHNLGRIPAAVSVLSVGGVEVEAGVTHVSNNQLVVEFASSQVGSVRVF